MSHLYIWPTRALYLGRSFDAELHKHHAAQIALGLDDDIELTENGSIWKRFRAILISPDKDHAVRCCGEAVAMMYVEKDSTDYESIVHKFRNHQADTATSIHVDENTSNTLLSILQGEVDESGANAQCEALVTEPGSTTRAASFDERVKRVVDTIHSAEGAPVSLSELAHVAHLSESRLSHVFRDQMGIAIRSYIVWRRLRVAVQLAAQGATLMEAAHSSGFSDSAHLSRTFRSMFGVAPSFLFGNRVGLQIFVSEEK